MSLKPSVHNLPDEQLLALAEEDMRRLQHDHTMLNLTLPEAMILLAQVQLALRHPGNTGSSAAVATRLARRLERIVSLTPAIGEIARRGWDQNHDIVKQEGKPNS